jgi:DNA-directed RNA polymerase specialized sigma24 family protein
MSTLSATEKALKRPEFSRLLWMLPEDCQPVVAMRFGGGMTVEEIASRTGKDAAGVREILRKSLDLLRQRLKPERELFGGGFTSCTSRFDRSPTAGRGT